MKIAQIIAEVREKLEPWVQAQNGRITVARDPWQAYELVASGPRGLLVVLGWGGERIVDAPRNNPLATARIEITVGSGMGLTAEPDANTFRSVGDRPALTDMIDEMIQTVAAITLTGITTTSRVLEYQGTEPMALPTGIRLAAFQVTFNVTRKVLINPQTT